MGSLIEFDDRTFTRDDLIAGGLCLGGVNAVMRRLSPIAAAVSVHEVMPRLSKREADYLKSALALDGYSDGNGYGYGYSDGNGYGYGYSDGDGYGYGYGYGYSYSDGNGCGYGYSYSDGYSYSYSDGNGCGYGYSYGDGYGDGGEYED